MRRAPSITIILSTLILSLTSFLTITTIDGLILLGRPHRRLTPVRYGSASLRLSETTLSESNTSVDDKTTDLKDLADSVFSTDQRHVILFDGVCNLCNGAVNYALDHDVEGFFRFVSLQSQVGKSLLIRAGKKPNDISSIVLVTPTDTYFKSDAVVRIARKLDSPAAFIGFLGPVVPVFLKNVVYDFVAVNRYKFGEADQCRLWDDNFDDRFIPDP